MVKIVHNRYLLKDLKLLLVRSLLLLIFLVFLLSCVPRQGYAEEPVPGVDFMFVIDESGSMKAADKQENVQQALKLFVDLSVGTENRLGYVLYNDAIVATEPLTKIVTEKEKATFLSQVETTERSGNTDLGLGLVQAELMLKESKSENKQVVIVLNDGETFSSAGSAARTAEASSQDIESAVASLQSAQVPVYSISLNEEQLSINPALESIASATGGDAFTAYSAGELSEICFEIYGEFMNMPMQLAETVTTTNELQNIDIKVPNEELSHFKIAIASNQPLEEVQISGPSDDITIEKSGNYAIIDLANPTSGTCHLQIRGTSDDTVKIYVLGDYPFEARMAPLPSHLANGSSVPVSVYLWDAVKQEKVTDPAIFESLSAELIVHDSLTNTDERYAMEKDKNAFSYDYPVNGAAELAFSAEISSSSAGSSSTFTTTNNHSVASSIETVKPITFEQGRQSKDYNLDTFFLKDGKKPVSYQIVSSESNDEMMIKDHQLVTKADGNHEMTVTIQAKFSESDISQADVTVIKYPIWRYYWLPELVMLIVLTLFIIWIVKKRKSVCFHGRLEGYFLDTASGDEFPVQFWTEDHFHKRRKTTLHHLFDQVGVTEHLPESRHIYFLIRENDQLTFMHKTTCHVQLKAEAVASNRAVSIKNNDRLYITFEDGITEVELRVRKILT